MSLFWLLQCLRACVLQRNILCHIKISHLISLLAYQFYFTLSFHIVTHNPVKVRAFTLHTQKLTKKFQFVMNLCKLASSSQHSHVIYLQWNVTFVFEVNSAQNIQCISQLLAFEKEQKTFTYFRKLAYDQNLSKAHKIFHHSLNRIACQETSCLSIGIFSKFGLLICNPNDHECVTDTPLLIRTI